MASIGRASAALASGTVVSRALGFVNAAVLAWAIGQTGQGANAFALANQLPNNVYAIVAGGLLTAVLVPHIVRSATHADGGQDFVNRLITLGITVFAGVTIVATLAAPALVTLYSFGGGSNALSDGGVRLAVIFAYWCLPQIFFYALYALLGEVLNARGVFGPFTWAPALNNVVVIATLLVFVALYGADPAHRDPATWDTAQIVLVAGGATAGIAAQALVLLAFWPRTGLRFRPDFRWRGAGLGAPARAAGWTFAMILVTQAAGVVQSNVAVTADADDPSLAVLRTTWLIFMLPHSIIAVSIATPYFTRMSEHARDGRLADIRADLSAALRGVGLLVTGAAAALAAAAPPFAAVFANEAREVMPIAIVLLAFLIGLVPFSALFLFQRGFYALGDTRTPFLLQLVQSGLFVAGALGVLVVAPSAQVAAGIALVTSVAGTAQTIVAAIVLRARLGGLDGRRVVSRLGVYALATVPAAAAGVAVLWLLGGTDGGWAVSGKLAGMLGVAAVGAVALGVYLAVLLAARVPELRGVVALVRRR